jgi:hypothetical protein
VQPEIEENQDHQSRLRVLAQKDHRGQGGGKGTLRNKRAEVDSEVAGKVSEVETRP